MPHFYKMGNCVRHKQIIVFFFFFFYSNRGSLEHKQTDRTRKVYVRALIKIPAKQDKNTLDLTRRIKHFLKEHMDKLFHKILISLQEKDME